jgi:hypothetical protein
LGWYWQSERYHRRKRANNATKHEVKQVRVACEFVRTCAYPSMEETITLLEDGTCSICTTLRAQTWFGH